MTRRFCQKPSPQGDRFPPVGDRFSPLRGEMSPQVTKRGTGGCDRREQTNEGAPLDGANGCSPLIRHFVPPVPLLALRATCSPSGTSCHLPRSGGVFPPRGEGIDKTASNSIQGNGQKLPRKPSQSRIRSTALPRGEIVAGDQWAAKKPSLGERALSQWKRFTG